MYKICFYVPESHLEQVKQALFAHGAGKFGNYDHCSWQTLGTGQFRALDGAHPAIGKCFELNTVNEYKVETICEDSMLRSILDTLLEVHPYETPAFGYWKIATNGDINNLA